jgi:signal transduction histidine kinase/CheY-like chemotaxis protein
MQRGVGDEVQRAAARSGNVATSVTSIQATVAATIGTARRDGLGWHALPRVAQIYVSLVIAAGTFVLVELLPLEVPRPLLSLLVLAATCLTSSWKVNLPIPLASGSTLSVSCATKLTALLLLGPEQAVIMSVAGAVTQCRYNPRRPYPLYRTVFSGAAEAVAMSATGLAYAWLGGTQSLADLPMLARPLVGAIATYFLFDTGLVAAAIAASTGRPIAAVWRDDFLWSGVSFMVAGGAGAMAAIVIARGYHWMAVLYLAPIYLTYRTYVLFIHRLEDERRHVAEMQHLEQTRQQLLEREKEARNAAEEANRLKDQFLAVVSHELRTPLNAILGWSDMLRAGTLDDTRRARAFAAIYDSATRQAELIDELLDLARIMSGKLRLERTFVDLDEVVRSALNVIQPAADTKRIQLTLTLDEGVGVIYADRSRLQQIAWNLLSNAIKFTPEGGAVHTEVHRFGDRVEIIVTDTGVGIAADFLETMFEPFRQADGSTTRQHGGLGLGLSIVKHLVEAHGGAVAAESGGPGKGATLIARLPIAPPSEEQAKVEMATHPRSTPPVPPSLLQGLTVMVVDDEEQIRQVVAAQLEAHRAIVVTAHSAAQALELLMRDPVDVLLADIAMPGEDGYELIRKLRALHPAPIASVPAAALTAFVRGEDKLKALQAGFQLHLSKPIDAHTLVTAVGRLGGRVADRRHARSTVPGAALT